MLKSISKKDQKIDIIYKKKSNFFLFIKNFCKSLLFQIVIHLFVNLLIKKKNIQKEVTIIDYFCIEDHFDNNRYYGKVSTKNYLNKKNILFVPTFIIGKGIIKTLKRIYGLKNNKNILFKEHFLNFKDIYFSLFYYKELYNFKKKYQFLDKINYSNLIFDEIINYKNVSTILISKLNYYFIKNLKKEKIELKKAINWFENQQNDKAWNYALRKYYPKITTFGYQGFTIYPQYMCTHPSYSEEKCKVIPHKVIVIGKAYRNSRKEFFKNIKLINGPALTFQDVYKYNFNQENKKNILVILTGYHNLDSILLNWTLELSKNFKKIKIIIKPHPHLPISKINYDQKFNDNIEVVNLPLNKIYPKTKIVISCGPTSATIESLAYGYDLIIPILDVNDKLMIKMLKISSKKIYYADNEKKFILSVKKVLNNKKISKIKNKNKLALKRYLFNKSSKKNMRLFH